MSSVNSAEQRSPKVPLFSSTAAQLFWVWGTLSVFMVAGLSALAGSSVYRLMTAQISERLGHEAGAAATGVAAWASGHVSLVSLALHGGWSQGTDGALERAFLQVLLSQKDWLHVDILSWKGEGNGVQHRAQVFTSHPEDHRFGDRDPRVIQEKIVEMNEAQLIALGTKNPGNRRDLNRWFVTSPVQKIDLPMIQLWIPYKPPPSLPGEPEVAHRQDMVVVTLWLTDLLGVLPGQKVSADTRSYFILNDGELVASHDENTLKIGSISLPYFSEIKSLVSQPNAGTFIKQTSHGHIVALSPIENARGWVCVERNGVAALAGARAMAGRTLLWGMEFVLLALAVSYAVSRRWGKRIAHIREATLRIAAGQFGARVPLARQDELGILGAAVNHMAERLAHLVQRSVAAAVVQKEVEAAEATQALIFPKYPGFQSPLAQVCGRTQTASRCGGDWWGYFMTADGFEILLVGDATGHGLPAALVTALVYASAQCFVDDYNSHAQSPQGPDPQHLLLKINATLWAAGHGRTTMTLFAWVLDPVEPQACYANAGHPFPYLWLPSRGAKPQALNLGGAALGAEETPLYGRKCVNLERFCRVVFYTDGVPELLNAQGEPFGKRAFLKALEAHSKKVGWECMDALSAALRQHAGGHALQDDMTWIVLDYAPAGQSGEPVSWAPGAPGSL